MAGQAMAGNSLNHPWMMDVAPLPVTDEVYAPPEWLYQCPVVMADAGGIGQTAGSCLPQAAMSAESREIVFDETTLLLLQEVNDEVSHIVGGTELTEAMAAAILKKERLLTLGFPASILSYAVAERPAPDGDDIIFTDHFVLVVQSARRAWILDTAMHDVLPWQYSPHRLYGTEVRSGEWRVVIDDRDDPLDIAIEWYEAME